MTYERRKDQGGSRPPHGKGGKPPQGRGGGRPPQGRGAGKPPEGRSGDRPDRKKHDDRPHKPRRPVHSERHKHEPRVVEGPAVLYTVGMGRRQLQELMQLLVDTGIEMVADLRNFAAESGHGFTRERDIAFLLKEVAGIEYRREELLVPQREMREQYRRDQNWGRFEASYLALLSAERVHEVLDRERYAAMRTCLLGDQDSAEHDHRRLAAEYLKQAWEIGAIRHL